MGPSSFPLYYIRPIERQWIYSARYVGSSVSQLSAYLILHKWLCDPPSENFQSTKQKRRRKSQRGKARERKSRLGALWIFRALGRITSTTSRLASCVRRRTVTSSSSSVTSFAICGAALSLSLPLFCEAAKLDRDSETHPIDCLSEFGLRCKISRIERRASVTPS